MCCGLELGQLVCLLRRFKYDVNVQAGGDPRTLYLMTSFVWEYLRNVSGWDLGWKLTGKNRTVCRGRVQCWHGILCWNPGKDWDGQDQVGCDKVHWTSERERTLHSAPDVKWRRLEESCLMALSEKPECRTFLHPPLSPFPSLSSLAKFIMSSGKLGFSRTSKGVQEQSSVYG